MKKQVLLNEIIRRVDDEDTLYAIIGPEIKLRRLKLSRTLKFVSFKICSISYTSKIENNEIKPNRVFLYEISKKVNMTEDEVSGLFDLREALRECVKSFLYGDVKIISDIVNKNCVYYNYRYVILRFIDDLSKKDLNSAKERYEELTKIIKGIVDYDFKIFAVFSSIYLYLCGNLNDAISAINQIRKLELSRDLIYLTDLYMFYCLAGLCRADAILYYQKSRDDLLSIGSFEVLDDLYYNLGLFLYKNDALEELPNIVSAIRNPKMKTSISFLLDYKLEKSIGHYNKKQLIGYAKNIYNLNRNIGLEDLEKFDYYRPDDYIILFKYLLLDKDVDRINYVIEEVIPFLEKSDDFFLRKEIIRNVVGLCEKTCRYKLLFDILTAIGRWYNEKKIYYFNI